MGPVVVEERGEIEELLFEQLAGRGWTVRSESRRGRDLDLEVELEGTKGRVLLRHAGQERGGVEASMLPPAFVRVDLGEAEAPEGTWSCQSTEVSFGRDLSGDERTATIGTQIRIGKGWAWAVVATGVGAPVTPARWRTTIERLLERIEATRPDRPLEERLEAGLCAAAGASTTARAGPGPRIPIRPVLCGLWLLAGAGATAIARVTEGRTEAVLVLAFFLGVAALAATLDLVRRLRARRAPEPGWAGPFLRILRASGAFADPCVEMERPLFSLPVVAVGPDGRRLPRAVLVTASGLSASAPARGATLRVDQWSIAPPEGVLPECLLLPPRWALLSIEGDEALLDRLPAGPRRQRHEGRVTWGVGGDELDRGELVDLFERVTSTLEGDPQVPYR